MSRKLILWLCALGKLVLSALIVIYFWKTNSLESYKDIPFTVLLLAVAYIILQLISRKFSSTNRIWDWVYYLGLVSIMVSVTFSNQENLSIFNSISDYGTLLLVLPIFIEFYYLIQDK